MQVGVSISERERERNATLETLDKCSYVKIIFAEVEKLGRGDWWRGRITRGLKGFSWSCSQEKSESGSKK